MKLSEAILLGSTVLTAKAGGQYFDELEAGCALGMAGIALGGRFVPVVGEVAEKERRTLGAEVVWGNWMLQVVMRTCDCMPLRVPRAMRIKDIITHLFDYHFMEKRDWTLDQLAAWVEKWEPRGFSPRETLDTAPPQKIPSPGQVEDQRRAADEWQAIQQVFAPRQIPDEDEGRSLLKNRRHRS